MSGKKVIARALICSREDEDGKPDARNAMPKGSSEL
jgi:hypothetical protein